MFNTPFFANALTLAQGVSAAKSTAQDAVKLAEGVASSVAISYDVTTDSQGKAKVDYTALKLAKAPRITCLPRLADGDLPVMFELVGEPTTTSCTVRCRRIASALNTGVLPSYTAVAGVKLFVYVRPVA
ncbi:hypothetical protein [uncultured Pseudomonas sp.]|uniref:hypothetical protein n=1 Tax=uncultured Pseudomonas sp. TaxID=114707 RepID=UPI0025FAFBD7|nr:hypothetical protein [uncultured Pseudomonas sp.]